MCIDHYFYAGDFLKTIYLFKTLNSNTDMLARVERGSLPSRSLVHTPKLKEETLAQYLRQFGSGSAKQKSTRYYTTDVRLDQAVSPYPSMRDGRSHFDADEFIGFENSQQVSDNGHEVLLKHRHALIMPQVPSLSCDEASFADSDDSYMGAGSLISDAEVQDRLQEPALIAELERLLLRKPKMVQYPAMRREVLLQDNEYSPIYKANERIFCYQKIIYTEDPQMLLWEGVKERVEWGAGRILAKRAENNHDPFIFLNHRTDFTVLLNDPLTLHNEISAEMMDFIKEQWGSLAMRYGEFDLLQNEQAMFVNKLFCILVRYQEAIASHSLVTKDAVASLFHYVGQAMREFFAIEYGFRVSVVELLAPEDLCSRSSE